MTDYSKPLVVDTISWWINNASDRYIVMAFCGASITGINVMLNIPLTFFFNALGASFATLMSYFTVWLIRLYKSYKLFEFTVEIKKDALNYFVLLLQAVVQIAGLSLLRETFIEIILFVFGVRKEKS